MPLITQRSARRLIRQDSAAVISVGYLVRWIEEVESYGRNLNRLAERNRQEEGRLRALHRMTRTNPRLEVSHLHAKTASVFEVA